MGGRAVMLAQGEPRAHAARRTQRPPLTELAMSAHKRPRRFGGIGGRGTKRGRKPQGRIASGVGSDAPCGSGGATLTAHKPRRRATDGPGAPG
jgi:hypothetical protein